MSTTIIPNVQRTQVPIAALRANDWFRNYVPESEKKIRNLTIKEDETLKQLKETFRKFKPPWPSEDWHGGYASVVPLIRNIKYSPKDITNFSLSLTEFQDEEVFSTKAGFFLIALINESKENNFTIITEHLKHRIDRLGYHNTKNIIVQGDAGDWVGARMTRGTIIVKGNTGGVAGYRMEAGTITIKGNTGNLLGDEMNGGTIFLEGEYVSISNYVKGGNIYHKGKPIAKDGRVLVKDEWEY